MFLFLGLDGRLHWDEPGYIYTGAYLTPSEILEGDFEPSGIKGFNRSRILHLFLIRAVVTVVGVGPHALAALMLLYLLFLLLFSLVVARIVGHLMAGSGGIAPAVLLLSFTPIYLYLAFKTLPESPALLLSALATLALLESLKSRRLLWIGVGALSLAAVALLRNLMALFFVSFVFSLLLLPGQRRRRTVIAVHAAVIGLGALLLVTGGLATMGIGLDTYLWPARAAAAKPEPMVYTILNTLLEGGLFLLLLPLALIHRQREAGFFLTWFLSSTASVLLVLQHVEARYLAANLGAMAGLFCLAIRAASAPLAAVWRRRRAVVAAIGLSLLILVVTSNHLAVATMGHEVQIGQMARMLSRLDRLYGTGSYDVLTPWSYTDFHYLRLVYPERRVYSVYGDGGSEEGPSLEKRYYGERAIDTLAELGALQGPLIYLGFQENPAVANLRRLAERLPFRGLQAQFDKRSFLDHLTLSWMWDQPDLAFEQRIREGHYVAYEVSLRAR